MKLGISIMEEIADFLRYGPQGSDDRKYALDNKLADAAVDLMNAVTVSDFLGTRDVRDDYITLSRRLRSFVEAKQGQISDVTNPNLGDLCGEDREVAIRVYEKLAERPDSYSWTKNAHTLIETNGLIRRYLTGRVLADVTLGHLSDNELFPGHEIPTGCPSTEEMIDRVFDPNSSFREHESRLGALYSMMARDGKLDATIDIVAVIEDRYREE